MEETNMLVRGLTTTRTLAKEVRREGSRINGNPKLERIEDASLVFALAEVSGLLDLLGLGLKVEAAELKQG